MILSYKQNYGAKNLIESACLESKSIYIVHIQYIIYTVFNVLCT